eukprot:TRINITY_DN65420_c0_g1_i2.p1 TRINITY_DN65420_c0_g1~~TRINITY_DN65420_c0_g1_i2.p1  ORF type:complete len:333 (+),score=38.26 TRINITY_DN65420_c0_g1_i2:167-1165(+)
MPPLPVLCRAVLAGTLKGAPVQIQYLPSSHGAGREGPAAPVVSDLLDKGGSLDALTTSWPPTPLSDRSHPSRPVAAVVEAAAAVEPEGESQDGASLVKMPVKPSSREQEQLVQQDQMLFVQAIRNFLVISGLGVLLFFGLWRGLLAESTTTRKDAIEPDKKSQHSLASHPALRLGQEQGPQAPRLVETAGLQARAQEVAKPQDVPLSFPTVCPPYMRASEGAQLSMTLAPSDQSTWSCLVLGLGASVAVRGPPVQLLTANLRPLRGPASASWSSGSWHRAPARRTLAAMHRRRGGSYLPSTPPWRSGPAAGRLHALGKRLEHAWERCNDYPS